MSKDNKMIWESYTAQLPQNRSLQSDIEVGTGLKANHDFDVRDESMHHQRGVLVFGCENKQVQDTIAKFLLSKFPTWKDRMQVSQINPNNGRGLITVQAS